MKKRIFYIGLFLLMLLTSSALIFALQRDLSSSYVSASKGVEKEISAAAAPPKTAALPPVVLLDNRDYYVAQTFNNCGPAALSMMLSYYGIRVDQQTLADILRPTNNRTGKGDDKSTTPEKLAAQAETYGLVAYFRPNGSIDLLKRLTAKGYPMMVRTLLVSDEDYAHYRVVRGYDESKKTIIEDDGFQGKNVSIAYNDFLFLWKPFNYGYVVFAAPDKRAELEAIIGEDVDELAAWKKAALAGAEAVAADPNDMTQWFNLSVADYYIRNYAGSVRAFEAAESALTKHVLWYQLEPIEAYYALGNYDKVFSLAQKIFSDNNLAYPDLPVLLGKSYLKKGDRVSARKAFETALAYNKDLRSARDALASLE